MSSIKGRTPKEIQQEASKGGLVAFFPQPKELLLDIDEKYETATIRWQAMLSHGPVAETMSMNNIYICGQFYTVSKNGNCHLYILLNEPVTENERIILQACLRSDPVRDLLALVRIREGCPDNYSIALFETQEAAKQVRQWRLKIKIAECRSRLQSKILINNLDNLL